MRSASTVSGPLLSVSTPASQQNRFAAVQLLTGQLLYFIVEGKSRVKEVYAQLITYMSAQGLQDSGLFALAFVQEDEYFFTDPESKLSKYSPKSWKSSSTYGLDQNGQPLLQLHLRVKFYVDTTKSICDDITRQHYYLQLRQNIADRGGHTDDGEQNLLPLVALGLQADLGDHTPETNISTELLKQYLPSKVYENNEHKVKQTLCALHKSHKGLSKSRAQTMFVQEAGLVHKSHLYRLRLNKSPPKQTQGSALAVNNVWLVICTKGIQLYHESLSQALSCLFLWSSIGKLCYDRKKFELKFSNTDRLVYYASSDENSKRLVALCKDTHAFNVERHKKLLATYLNNNNSDKSAFDGLKWTKDEKKSKSTNGKSASDNKKCENGGCSDSSISTTDQNTAQQQNPKDKVMNGSISSSVELGYSHTAQNSNMSDLDYSVQSAQDSSDVYLMYRQPRARTTYVENSNQSAHTSSGVYTCASYSSVSKDTASASFTTENCSSVGCNESGSGGGFKTAAISAATDKSKSANISSSSPVPPDTDSAYSASLPPETVALSSTSADGMNSDVAAAAITEQQVTAIDDCDGVADDGTDELYDLSNVDTSDSSYCVGGGAATTATTASDINAPSSSSKCGESGCGNRCTLGGYANAGAGIGSGNGGGRSRSGSVVSNSGSFRGDGSDPSEGGRGALLSADDLSDLIVGRKSLQTPRKGFYPSRPTTSSTLDSDSDYVTLPPPMNFVTGAPSLSNLSLANFDCGTGTAMHSDARHSFDLLPNAVKYCGGHHHHHHHHHHQCTVVNSNNYLDVHKSGSAFYHHIYPAVGPVAPPVLHARQPPPPPPPPRPKRSDPHLEQYKQQLRSDVDFVVYPLQDPAVSRQEYVDAKLARGRRQQQQYHRYYGRDPPSYQANAHLYRSTPNVAAAVSPPPPPPSSSSASSSSLSHHQYPHRQLHHHLHLPGQQLQSHQQQPPPPLPPLPPHLKYASNQNLLFPATVAASADYAANHRHHHRLQPLPVPPPIRTYSHDDLLAATSVAPTIPPKMMFRRRPPPPPPPVTGLQKPAAVVHPRRASTADASTTTSVSTSTGGPSAVLDIKLLREKSRNLDLPLISALCNDQTLLKQTNALTSTTENKATQTVATGVPSSSFVTPAASSSHQPSLSAEPQTNVSSNNKSNCSKCPANSASSFSPSPPSFLSAVASSSPVVATAVAVKTTKSKTNHVKTNTNVI